MEGEFEKYMNNTGVRCVPPEHVVGQKAKCLSHFSFKTSNNKLKLFDIQGSGHTLLDPEIASVQVTDDNASESEYLFCAGNLSNVANNNFLQIHECNKYWPFQKRVGEWVEFARASLSGIVTRDTNLCLQKQK